MSIGSDPEFAARPQLSEVVARYVRRRIFDGPYRAGEYLRLDQIAGELGISATPVREALLNLRAEGLLVQQPRRGFMVLAVTARDIADVPTCRPSSAVNSRRALPRTSATSSWPSYARSRTTSSRRTSRMTSNAPCGSTTNSNRTINVAADSPKLTQFISGITRYAPESVFPTVTGWPKQSIRDHRRVIAEFERHDANRARMTMAEHFTGRGRFVTAGTARTATRATGRRRDVSGARAGWRCGGRGLSDPAQLVVAPDLLLRDGAPLRRCAGPDFVDD
jgi:DNA-binding GntR family transcriptional regulator